MATRNVDCRCDVHLAFRQDTSIRDYYQIADVELGTSGSAEALERMMAIDPDEIRESLQKNNAVLLEFASETYGRLYGGMNRRYFFGGQKREGEIPKGPAKAAIFHNDV